MTIPLPFAPRAYWTVHRNGAFLVAVSDEYRVELRRSSGHVLRVERVYDRVPVSSAEAAFERGFVERRFRQANPTWKWSAPMPDGKPPFNGLYAGRDGRIWVSLSATRHAAENDGDEVDDASAGPALEREATSIDESGVQRVVRYRIEMEESEPDPVVDPITSEGTRVLSAAADFFTGNSPSVAAWKTAEVATRFRKDMPPTVPTSWNTVRESLKTGGRAPSPDAPTLHLSAFKGLDDGGYKVELSATYAEGGGWGWILTVRPEDGTWKVIPDSRIPWVL